MRRASALLIALFALAFVGLMSLAFAVRVADWRTRYKEQQVYQERRIEQAWRDWESRRPR